MLSVKKNITLSRKKLYSEIWENNISKTALKYNLKLNTLSKLCEENNIPKPSSGYWTKKAMGKDLSNEILALPERDDDEIFIKTELIKVPLNELKREFFHLPSLSDDDYNKLVKIADELTVKERPRLHQRLVSFKERYDALHSSNRNGYGYSYYYHENGDDRITKQTSAKSIKRILKILDSLYKAVEDLGGSIKDSSTIILHKDEIKLTFVEAKDDIPHVLTKEEQNLLKEYEYKLKIDSRYAYKPNIRKYDHPYNGKITLELGYRHPEFKDKEGNMLEDQIGDILIAIFEAAEVEQKDRLYREEQERIREEQIRQKMDLEARRAFDQEQLNNLVQEANRYDTYKKIIEYVEAAVENGLTDEKSEWYRWALEEAEYINPVNPELENKKVKKYISKYY